MNLLKSILAIFVVLSSCGAIYAQHIISLHSDSFTKTDNDYEIDKSQLIDLLSVESNVRLQIPIPDYVKAKNNTKEIVLTKHNLLSDNYSLFSSTGKVKNTASKYTFFHGYVSGDSNSKVTLTLVDNTPIISIMDDDGNYEIYPSENNGFKGSFRTVEDNFDTSTWSCATPEGDDKNIQQNNSQKSTNSECVEVFLEIDHNMYNKKGSSIANTEAWAMSLMNQVSILFMEHEVPLNISGIQVWDTIDPYIGATNTSQALTLFRNNLKTNPNFNGRLGHLLSGRSLGGGIAYLNALCSTSINVAVSANLSGGVTSYPTYSWNTMVVAHELGHNFGSPHTHNCSWNGDNTAIDGCYNTEGSCTKPAIPYDDGGTIMSYCHLTSAGINLSNGFGPQPGTLIKDRYENATCVTGNNCAPVTPFNDVCSRAKSIDVFDYCIEGIFSTDACNPSGNGGSFSCGNTGDEKDIWFMTTYPSIDSFYLELSGINGKDVVVEIYKGSCSSLTSLDCAFSVSGDTIIQNIYDSSLAGEEVFIRIVEDGSDEEIDFRLCLYSPELPCSTLTDSLLLVYNTMGGASWTNKNGWVDGISEAACDYCNWYGITCDYTGKIKEINLSNNNLSGTISPKLVDLQYIREMDLSYNNLSGPIPLFWDSLDLLTHINLSNNNLSDTIPSVFIQMNKLNTLFLDHNNLIGTLPDGLGYGTLRSLSASYNDLSGCFSNGISSLCSRDSLNLSNNPNLVFTGDVTLLCDEYLGGDYDKDNYCRGVGDCNDYDDEINQGASEVDCDGIDNNCNTIIDENSDYGPNIWIGPDTLGVWTDSTNWSMGHPPMPCELVEIGISDNSHVHFDAAQYTNLTVRSITVGPQSSLRIGQNISLQIKVDGRIWNYGTLVIEGYISHYDQENSNKTAIYNEGIMKIDSFGGFNINDPGIYGIENKAAGKMYFSGYSWIGNYQGTTAIAAIRNEGEIYILGNLGVSGTYIESGIHSLPGAAIYVEEDGNLELYGN